MLSYYSAVPFNVLYVHSCWSGVYTSMEGAPKVIEMPEAGGGEEEEEEVGGKWLNLLLLPEKVNMVK